MHHGILIQQKKETDIKKKDSRKMLSIVLNSIQSNEYRSLGAELVANEMWNRMGFEEILANCKFTNREIALSKIVIDRRLIFPSSDFDTWKWLNNRNYPGRPKRYRQKSNLRDYRQIT
ncbi:MAG: transposase IS4 family [Chitinophagaceae bacterium]|nr:MAG: transposase IS4 family [Chitinophagaceae bacterium]